MGNNIFQNFQEKKKQLAGLASEALDSGWIDEASYDNIIKKLNADKLTIGVIGQMKCGKSTFLNSFLFGRPLLPAATTPMTAALSVITYGDKKGLEIEFYSPDEWDELCEMAKRNENDTTDEQTKSSIKAAKELYEKSLPIKSQLQGLLGKTVPDDIDNLIEYVGADGKYVSIVKSVKITLPEEWLKGVEIVDTPGFNDPVVSREERTKEFLKKADVVLMMLFAGRAFDATDRDILFDKVRRVGVGKIILAVNKYDIQLLENESPEQIKQNVTDEIRKAMRSYRDESLNELLEDLDPVLVSAQMALLGKMSIAQINADDNLKEHYNKAFEDFELTSQQQMLKLSRISELEDKVKDIIVNQKEKVLIEKPKNLILAKARNMIEDIEGKLMLLHKKKEELSMPDEELDERIANLEKAQNRIERKVERAEIDLEDEFDTEATRLFRDLQDLADEVRGECDRIIENYKRDELSRKLNNRLERFKDKEFPRRREDISKRLKRAFDDSLYQLSDDIESILKKYVDDTDEVSERFIYAMRKGLDIESEIHLDDAPDNVPEEDGMSVFEWILLAPLFPIGFLITSLQTGRDEARERVKAFFDSIDWSDMKQSLEERKEKFISTLGGDAAKELIRELVEQAKDAKGTKEEKEKALEVTNQEILKETADLHKMKEEFNHIKAIMD